MLTDGGPVAEWVDMVCSLGAEDVPSMGDTARSVGAKDAPSMGETEGEKSEGREMYKEGVAGRARDKDKDKGDLCDDGGS